MDAESTCFHEDLLLHSSPGQGAGSTKGGSLSQVVSLGQPIPHPFFTFSAKLEENQG